MSTLPPTSEAVVIGGGFIGCGIAYQLAKRGVGVTLVEQEHIAWGASGRNGGHVSPAAGYTEQFLPFTTANFHLLARLGDELDADFQFRLSGGMELVTEAAAVPEMRATTRAITATGFHAADMTGDEAQARVPAIGPDVIAARWTDESAHLNPMLLAHTFARAAARHGARVVTGVRVIAIEQDARGVSAVVTTAGRIATRAVVSATNGWAARIGALIGLDVPVQPQRGQILATIPVPPLLPCTFGYYAEGAIHYWRQTPAGNIVIGGGRAYDTPGIGSDDRRNTADLICRFPAHVARTMPGLKRLPVLRFWGGTMGFTPDYGPLIGPHAAVPGFFTAAGFNGNGTPWAVVAGILVAQLLSEEVSPFPTACVSPDRFAPHPQTTLTREAVRTP